MSEKLNEWAVFNEKNKELCEWLTQMESRVSQNGDISIEEMIEKLRKVISAHCLNNTYVYSVHSVQPPWPFLYVDRFVQLYFLQI